MKVLLSFTLLLISHFTISAQQADNFVVTDVHGITHNLYEDHLNQGKTVMVEIFFTTCPPCIAIATHVEDLYQDWGGGQGDVEFFKMTIQSFDDDAKILAFDNTYGITFPGISVDGGSLDALGQFTDGTFGTFYGTPTFIVIAPDGTVSFDVSFNNLGDTIESTGAVGLETTPDAIISLDMSDNNNNPISITDIASVWLKSSSNTAVSYNLGTLTNNTFSFSYPIANLGTISNPYLEVISTADPGPGLSALDLIVLQKHVLDIQPLTDPYKLAAADINGSGTTSALDIIELVKVTLGIQPTFNNNSTHLFFFDDCTTCVNTFPIDVSPGDVVELNITAVRVGDVN